MRISMHFVISKKLLQILCISMHYEKAMESAEQISKQPMKHEGSESEVRVDAEVINSRVDAAVESREEICKDPTATEKPGVGEVAVLETDMSVGGDWLRRLSRFELKAIVQRLAESHGEDAVKAAVAQVAPASFLSGSSATSAPPATTVGQQEGAQDVVASSFTLKGDMMPQKKKRRSEDDDQASGEAGRSNVCEEGQKNNKKKDKAQKQGGQKGFDMAYFAQRHISLHLAYFGEAYRGLAVQDTTPDTIEQHLFQALKKACLITDRASAKYSRCGRTDVGVSALGQVITLTVRSQLEKPLPESSTIPATKTRPPKTKKAKSDNDDDANNDSNANVNAGVNNNNGNKDGNDKAASDDANEIDYPVILNRLLPDDIFVLGWAPAPSSDFQARFNCETRTYRYYFMARELDLEAMQKAADLLVGTHDFRHFCKMDVDNVKNFVRRIEAADIVQCQDAPGVQKMCYFRVRGSAFLWHQIRCLVSVLFLVGQGLEEASVVTSLLDIEQNPRKPVYEIASELPLVLYESEYSESDVNFYYNPKVLAELRKRLELREAKSSITAAMTRGVIDFLDTRAPVVDDDGKKIPFKESLDCVPIPTDFPPAQPRKPGRVAKISAKYVKLFDRPLCDSYEERVMRMSDRRLEQVKKKHGWDLASDVKSTPSS